VSGIVTISVTAAGAGIAGRLPFPHRQGPLVAQVREAWGEVDGLVLVGAMGIAVRAVGPLLGDKRSDPAVVCVDDRGRWAVAVAGGHAGGANALAAEVAALLGAEAVVTTATDGAGLPALDALPGWRAAGDVAGVTRRWLDGEPPTVEVDDDLEGWPLPAGLPSGVPARRSQPAGVPVIRVTDRVARPSPGGAALHPQTLVVGVGASRGADPQRMLDLVDRTLAGAGLEPASVAAVATIDSKAAEPAVSRLAERWLCPVLAFPAGALAGVDVPHPSPVVEAAVGTPSVAEAAALLAAGPGAVLAAAKAKDADATVAVARRRRPPGEVAVVGLGPGTAALRTPAAAAAVRHADCVVGYGAYVDQAADLLGPAQEVLRYPIGEETGRCDAALARAAAGRRVALVCSGDPGVYAMAGLALERAPAHGSPPVQVVPGVTAALAAAAVLGAPLAHDHATISLSDLLTPWEAIARRLEAAALGDFAVTLYNPRSARRRWQLGRALDLLATARAPDTPVGVVTGAGRPGQRVDRVTLGTVDAGTVGMESVVVVGSSTTRWLGDRMVTPRGYRR
jgi:cobalt-precorrin 5A hydrolase/precorrin-3B C17-methyltransferase